MEAAEPGLLSGSCISCVSQSQIDPRVGGAARALKGTDSAGLRSAEKVPESPQNCS